MVQDTIRLLLDAHWTSGMSRRWKPSSKLESGTSAFVKSLPAPVSKTKTKGDISDKFIPIDPKTRNFTHEYSNFAFLRESPGIMIGFLQRSPFRLQIVLLGQILYIFLFKLPLYFYCGVHICSGCQYEVAILSVGYHRRTLGDWFFDWFRPLCIQGPERVAMFTVRSVSAFKRTPWPRTGARLISLVAPISVPVTELPVWVLSFLRSQGVATGKIHYQTLLIAFI